MAKIKNYLEDILKQIEKNNISIDKKIDLLKEELNTFSDFPGYETPKEKELKKAIKYLQDTKKEKERLAEYKEESQALRIENLREKTQQKEAYNYFLDIFTEETEKSYNKTQIFNILRESDTINFIIKECKNDLLLDNINLYSTYLKALNDLKKIYIQDINTEKRNGEELEKALNSRQSQNIERVNQTLRNITYMNLCIIGLSKWTRHSKGWK